MNKIIGFLDAITGELIEREMTEEELASIPPYEEIVPGVVITPEPTE